MVKHMARIIIVSLMLWSVAAVMGQAPSGPPQPEPEHKKPAPKSKPKTAKQSRPTG